MPKNKKYDFSGYATKANKLCTDGRVIMPNAFQKNDGEKVPLVWQHAHNSTSNILGHALLENREDGVYAYGFFNGTQNATEARELLKHGDITAMSIYANSLVERDKKVMHGMIKEVSLVLSGANPGALIDYVAFEHGDGSVVESDEEAIIFSDSSDTDFKMNDESEEVDNTEVVEEKEEVKEEELTHKEDSESDDKTTINDIIATMNKEQKLALMFFVQSAMEGSSKVKHAEDSEEAIDVFVDSTLEHKDEQTDKTVGDIFQTMNKQQKEVVYYLVSQGLKSTKSEDDEEVKHTNLEGDSSMKKNIFDDSTKGVENELKHEDLIGIINTAKEGKMSLKDAFLQHNITNIEYLFPDAKLLDGSLPFIKRQTEWVSEVFGASHHSPFSRVKTVFADITDEEARARGYVKGKKKADEVIALLKRTTEPQTIYKKQKLDRDDVLDITDMDIVAWLKAEMRLMLEEEIARAMLVSDGRSPASDDKIIETKIRPIYKDDSLYTIRAAVESTATTADVIDEIVRARKDYRGSGNPTFFATPELVGDMLLLKDTTGRRIYDTVASLASALRVSKIVEVPVMENLKHEVTGDNGYTADLMGIVVNMNDYTLGADKGGSVQMFEDFDIDYNQQKYLIETRVSGALRIPYSAIVIEKKEAAGG